MRDRLAAWMRAPRAAAGEDALERRWPERRPVVLSAAAVLFAGVLALRLATGDPADAIGLLYVVPIALVALELGLVAGLAAAGLAFALTVAWAVGTGAEIGVIGAATRGVAFVAVGGLAGRFSDRMRDAQHRQTQLLGSGLALAHLSAHDDLAGTLAEHAQKLVGARGVRVSLHGRVAQRGELSGPRHELPIEARGIRQGTLTIATPRPLAPEDRLSLVAIALQAAVAQDNQRLLESERERAAMRAELREARRTLDARRAQLRGLIAGQEAERSQVSHELHEEAAQSLAAVLLGLGALERELGSELAPSQVAMLRSHVDQTLRSLRSLAVSLRPPALQLGLKAALEQLAADARHGPVEVDIGLPSPTGLDREVETTIYRVAEEALGAGAGASRSLAVFLHPERRELHILLDVGEHTIDEERLAALGGRLELAGGTLATTPDGVEAIVPLPPETASGRFARGRRG